MQNLLKKKNEAPASGKSADPKAKNTVTPATTKTVTDPKSKISTAPASTKTDKVVTKDASKTVITQNPTKKDSNVTTTNVSSPIKS